MKYLPTLDLWDSAIHSAIVSGQLKLQCGQWVSCGSNQLSRFVSVDTKAKTINVCHGANNKDVIKRFKMRVKTKRGMINRLRAY